MSAYIVIPKIITTEIMPTLIFTNEKFYFRFNQLQMNLSIIRWLKITPPFE